MDPSEVSIQVMTADFLLWRCLHNGPLTPENIDLMPPESPVPWGVLRERNLPILQRMTELYGGCGVLASHAGRVVGSVRFFPKAVWQTPGAGMLCLQQDFPAGPAPDFALRDFPPFEQIADKTLVVHCMAAGQPGRREDPYRRAGIGSRMVVFLADWARRRGWQAIETAAYHDLELIYTVTGIAGRGFWEKLGFRLVETGVEPELERDGEFVSALRRQAADLGLNPQRVKDRYTMRLDLQAA